MEVFPVISSTREYNIQLQKKASQWKGLQKLRFVRERETFAHVNGD